LVAGVALMGGMRRLVLLLVGGACLAACISVETAPASPSPNADAGGGEETCIAVV